MRGVALGLGAMRGAPKILANATEWLIAHRRDKRLPLL
jgi:hypothetical protein